MSQTHHKDDNTANNDVAAEDREDVYGFLLVQLVLVLLNLVENDEYTDANPHPNGREAKKDPGGNEYHLGGR